jgi:hypothetical protein
MMESWPALFPWMASRSFSLGGTDNEIAFRQLGHSRERRKPPKGNDGLSVPFTTT